jgi:pseudaminic acid synthase
LAKKTIYAAKKAGADAIKLQTYTPDTITIDCNNKYFQVNQGTTWDGITLYELYKKAYTPWEWQPKLKKYAESLELIFFSTPFDITAVDFLEEMDVPAYKIASFEITDIPLIRYVASKQKPIIISTGIATKEDIDLALEECEKQDNEDIAILKCSSAYPTPIDQVNFKTIKELKKDYKAIIGLSDHIIGSEIPIASVVLGAKIIEKHFILDKDIESPDSKFSMEPDEFKSMVSSIRKVERSLGEKTYELTKNMKKSREHSKSLFVVKDIKKGEKFTKKNMKPIRPGFGLHPKYYWEVLDKNSKKNIKRGSPLCWKMVSP